TNLACTSGEARACLAAAVSLSRMSGGVPVGAYKANQAVTSTFFRPLSATVGIFGTEGERSAEVIAMPLILEPSLIWASVLGRLSSRMSTWPPISAGRD